jgi:holliday junction DNA helicase RuvA
MISYVAGSVLETSEGKCTVLIQQGLSKIGYLVNVPQSAAYANLSEGEVCEFFVHHHVREDASELFGFKTKVEREVFLTLLGVNGIGPKGAMGILTKIEISTLVEAVLTGDKEALTSVPGVGKKTAERMMIELADPLKKKMDQGLLPFLKGAQTSGSSLQSGTAALSAAVGGFHQFSEAKEALISLGYKDAEVLNAFKKLREQGHLVTGKNTSEVVRLSLKELK